MQSCPLVQVWQGPPALPQAVALSPERHWDPLQQPLQLEGLQALVLTQTPVVQLSEDLQAWQVLPP